jgi:hypothetical protein
MRNLAVGLAAGILLAASGVRGDEAISVEIDQQENMGPNNGTGRWHCMSIDDGDGSTLDMVCWEIEGFEDSPIGGSGGGGGGMSGGGGGGGGTPTTPQLPPDPPPDCKEEPPPVCAANKACESCGKRKKNACNVCKDEFDNTTDAIETDRMSCSSEVKSIATTHCRMGELPGGTRNSVVGGATGSNYPAQSVIIVGDNYAAAHNCYVANGNQWARTCPWAFDRQTCDVTFMGQTECTVSDEWMSCFNGWVAGHGGFQAQFGVNASAEWSTPINVDIKVGGQYQGTVKWAPKDGALGFCEIRAGFRRQKRDTISDRCKANVNAKYKGGEQCAY